MQWRKNTAKHRIINRSPYEALLGPISCGIRSLDIPEEMLDNLQTEEDLERIMVELRGVQNEISNPDIQPHSLTVKASEIPPELLSSEIPPEIPSEISTKIYDPADIPPADLDICIICLVILQENEAKPCSICEVMLHLDCGVNFDNADFVCPLCLRGRELVKTRQDCFKRQTIAAEKMTDFSEKKFPPLEIGECVTLAISKFDRGPLDFANIIGVISAKENGVYQIGTKDGLIKGWFPRTDVEKAASRPFTIEDVNKEICLTLREAASKQSMMGGQGFKKCSCKPSDKQCLTNRCVCKKVGHKCNSRCHANSTCGNL